MRWCRVAVCGCIEQDALFNQGGNDRGWPVPAVKQEQLLKTLETPLAIFYCPSRRRAMAYATKGTFSGDNWVHHGGPLARNDYVACVGDTDLTWGHLEVGPRCRRYVGLGLRRRSAAEAVGHPADLEAPGAPSVGRPAGLGAGSWCLKKPPSRHSPLESGGVGHRSSTWQESSTRFSAPPSVPQEPVG